MVVVMMVMRMPPPPQWNDVELARSTGQTPHRLLRPCSKPETKIMSLRDLWTISPY